MLFRSANKTTTLTGIIGGTVSNVTTITPKGIVVITKIFVVMTTQTGEIIRRTLAISDSFRQGDNNPNRRSRREPPQGYDDSPPRDYPQGDNRRQQDTSNRGNRNTTVVSTTTTSTRTNVRLHGQPYALPTILDYSRVAIRASPKMWRQ